MGVLLRCLMSCLSRISGNRAWRAQGCWTKPHLLESLVVDEASGIFWYIELTFLDVLAELPAMLAVSRFATA